MSNHFAAQTLLATRTIAENQRFELTFVDASGAKQTISVPQRVAADLAPVLASLASDLNNQRGPEFTKMPKLWAVGSARHERLVLIRFDDDPPYGLDLNEAQHLWREVREQIGAVSRLKPSMRQ